MRRGVLLGNPAPVVNPFLAVSLEKERRRWLPDRLRFRSSSEGCGLGDNAAFVNTFVAEFSDSCQHTGIT